MAYYRDYAQLEALLLPETEVIEAFTGEDASVYEQHFQMQEADANAPTHAALAMERDSRHFH